MESETRFKSKRLMSLLVIHSSSEMYGSDRMLLNVLEALTTRKQIVVHVLLPIDCSKSEKFEKELLRIGATFEYIDIPIIRRTYLNPIGILRLLRRMVFTYFKLEKFNPDLVWFATSATLLNSPIVNLRFRSRTFLHVQEIWGKKTSFLLSLFAINIQKLIVISNPVLQSLPKRLRHKASLITNAVKDSYLCFPPDRKSSNGQSVLFLYASRWTVVKGIDTLLSAWGKSKSIEKKLIIAGGPSVYGGNVDVYKEVESSSFSSSVEIAGEIHDLSSLIDKVDCVIVPSSWNEPFGIIAIEAMCRSTPVIASSGGGLGEIIKDGIDGFLFTNNNYLELAYLIDKVTDLDKSTLQNMGVAARHKYENNYSMKRFEEDICNLLFGVKV